jgi:hypothetical protein
VARALAYMASHKCLYSQGPPPLPSLER